VPSCTLAVALEALLFALAEVLWGAAAPPWLHRAMAVMERNALLVEIEALNVLPR